MITWNYIRKLVRTTFWGGDLVASGGHAMPSYWTPEKKAANTMQKIAVETPNQWQAKEGEPAYQAQSQRSPLGVGIQVRICCVTRRQGRMLRIFLGHPQNGLSELGQWLPPMPRGWPPCHGRGAGGPTGPACTTRWRGSSPVGER